MTRELTDERIRYPGSKSAAGVWQWILEVMPTHACYAEPFVGSGAVLRRKAPALRSLIADVDEEVLAWWRGLEWPGVEFIDGCGIAWLEQHCPTLGPDWLLYLDPPYVLQTRTKQKIYQNELTDDDHRRILSAIAKTDARVIISGYASSLYSSPLASWYRAERQAMTRGGVRTEVIWCNFHPARVEPQRPQIPGAGWRDRARIKKKVRRWRANFGVLPRHERRAILQELLAAEQSIDSRQR